MNTVELLQYALGNAFGILNQVTSGVTQEQADWMPPGVANPIGASYWHVISGVDEVVRGWGMNQPPLYQQEGWRERVFTVSAPEPERGGDYRTYFRAIRVDVATLHAYAQAVAEMAHAWLGALAPADLERVVESPVGELRLAELIETFVIWHVNAHCGEIAALKGCQGAQGYPF
jgi:hypothetical protein